MVSGGHAPSSAVVGVTVTLTTLAGVFAIGRLYTRIYVVKREGLDDYCIVAALLLTIGLTICMCEQVNYGMGTHINTLSMNDLTMSLKWFWSSVWIYYLALCFTKISILLQYLRVFPDNKFRVAWLVLMGVVIVYSICTFFTAMFECTPVQKFWDPTLEGTCLNQTAIWFVNASINIATDIATAVLPLPVLNKLHIPKRQKYLLMGVFGLGGFTCLISILRLQALYVVSNTDDISWDNPLAAIWSSTEVNVGILCSCLPTLKGLLARVYPNMFGTTHYYSAQNSALAGAEDVSSRPPEAHELEVGKRSPELEEEKERSSRSDGYGMEDKIDTYGYHSRSGGQFSHYESGKTRHIIGQQSARRNNEIVDDDGGTRRHLTTIPRSYQPMSARTQRIGYGPVH